MKLAFWNIKNKPCLLGELARCQLPDVMIAAECSDKDEALRSLQAADPAWTQVGVLNERIRIFHRPTVAVRHVHDTPGRFSLIAVEGGPMGELLIAGVHLSSQKNKSARTIEAEDVLPLKGAVLDAEKTVGHRRTILLGDFNLDPFAYGLSHPSHLWGAMDRRLVQRHSAKPTAFYNPMWSRLGDASEGPAGTYYYDSDNDADHYFHTFDQVLLRPELLPWFEHRRLVVISELNGEPLLSPEGLPLKARMSDHLPVSIELVETNQ